MNTLLEIQNKISGDVGITLVQPSRKLIRTSLWEVYCRVLLCAVICFAALCLSVMPLIFGHVGPPDGFPNCFFFASILRKYVSFV